MSLGNYYTKKLQDIALHILYSLLISNLFSLDLAKPNYFICVDG